MKYLEYIIGAVVSSFLLAGVAFNFLPTTYTEVLGFITGAACVWLNVKQIIWGFPLGIANNLFFIVLFMGVGLYGDVTLQVIYIVLGGLGWYWWLKGGENRTELKVSHASPLLLVVFGVVSVGATIIFGLILESIGGKSPWHDSLTTVMSLAAQLLLNRKIIENWHIWIAVDVIYIGLYASKELYLTSVLYLVFLLMCVVGYISWKKSLVITPAPATSQLEPALVPTV